MGKKGPEEKPTKGRLFPIIGKVYLGAPTTSSSCIPTVSACTGSYLALGTLFAQATMQKHAPVASRSGSQRRVQALLLLASRESMAAAESYLP